MEYSVLPAPRNVLKTSALLDIMKSNKLNGEDFHYLMPNPSHHAFKLINFHKITNHNFTFCDYIGI